MLIRFVWQPSHPGILLPSVVIKTQKSGWDTKLQPAADGGFLASFCTTSGGISAILWFEPWTSWKMQSKNNSCQKSYFGIISCKLQNVPRSILCAPCSPSLPSHSLIFGGVAGYLCSLSVKHLKVSSHPGWWPVVPLFYDCVRALLSSSAACWWCLICLQCDLL